MFEPQRCLNYWKRVRKWSCEVHYVNFSGSHREGTSKIYFHLTISDWGRMVAIFKLIAQLCSDELATSPKIDKATRQGLICLLLVSTRNY